MSSPIERVFALKHEADKRGLVGPLTGRPAYVMHAGQDFLDELLMEASLRWGEHRKFAGNTLTVFGIPVIPQATGMSPNGLKVVFELDG